MSYKKTINFLYQKLPIFQRKGEVAYKKDIGNIIQATKKLNNPHLKFKTIHVGGTNGKGSTSHFIKSILISAGYKVGLYTSPHLKDFRERISINNKLIEKKYVVDFVKNNNELFEELNLSFFEMTVALAFDYFANKKVDIAIIEVGLGGRLDSTNIITPEISVITNISLDHTNLLGNNIEDIAKEKAGIIKPFVPVVIGRHQEKTKKIFYKTSKENNSKLIYSDILFRNTKLTDYQQENINTSICVINELKKNGWKISKQQINNGIDAAINKNPIKGRWQILEIKPKVICDTAHNYDGIKNVLKEIDKINFEKLHFVLGMVNDKKIDDILNILPVEATYYFCKAKIERALDEKLLAKKAKKLKGRTYKSVKEALNDAKNNAKKNDLIFIGGSTFVVAEII
tara:strand:+ start:4117 stop:5316 length:1200 start_codon:yes stop_codon:yes gene_type:complete